MDASKLSDEELLAIMNGADVTQLSDEELLAIINQGSQPIQKPAQQPAQQPKTTAGGLLAAAGRGAAPYAALAATGAAFGGLPGAAALPAIGAAADIVVPLANWATGKNFESPTTAVKGLLDYLGVPKADAPMERIVESVSNAVANTGSLIKGGELLIKSGSTALQKIGRFLSETPALQLGSAGASAGAGQTVQERGGGAGAQILASLAAGTATPALMSTGKKLLQSTPRSLEIQAAIEAEQAMVKEAEQYGRVLTSDVRPPKTAIGKGLQTATEKSFLFSTAKTRQAQQTEREQAVLNLLRGYGADQSIDLVPDVASDLISQRSAKIERFNDNKTSVIKDVTNKMTDLAKKGQEHPRGYLGGEKNYPVRTSEKQLRQFMPRSKAYSIDIVPLQNTLKTIDGKIANLSKNDTSAAQEAIERLRQTRDALTNDRNLQGLEDYRKYELSKAWSDDPPISVEAKTLVKQAMQDVYDPLRKDMGNYIQFYGDKNQKDLWRASNKQISNVASEIDKKSYKTALENAEITPELVGNLLFSKKPSDVRQIYKGLSEQGKANAR